jgi:hypothetical protein
MKYSYPVFAFRQQADSPIQVAFVAHAGDIVSWSGIPRKSDELLTGFQRFLDPDRINQEIVPFFQNPANCSPTAIIVALRSDSGLGSCTLEKLPVEAGKPVQTNLFIEVDVDALTTDKVFEAALNYVDTRLAGAVGGPDKPEEGGVEDEEEGDEEGEEIAHLGSVTVTRMKELLADKGNWANADFRRAIADYVKPVFLIDGQHRAVAAAKFGPKGLPFIVCGLFDPAWEEQVFQFTVVNLKPKRIPPALITSIAGLSLTRHEQERVEERLAQADVKMAEVSIMSLVAYDEESPFVDMVDMAVGGPQEKEDKLGYGAMKRIAKVWYRASRSSLTLIAKSAFSTNSITKARQSWRDDRVWFDFFCGFWTSIRNRYPDLWKKSPTNRLFVGAHLWALQEVLLGAADGQLPPPWTLDTDDEDVDLRTRLLVDKLLMVVKTALEYLPTEMWTVEWAKASQDTNAGREELKLLFAKFLDEGMKAGHLWKQWRNDPWFKKADQ